MAALPWLARAKARLSLGSFPLGYISRELADLISLVVSQENSCRYCYGATRMFLLVLGRREQEIEQLERDLEVDDVSEADRRALEFARKLTRANPRVSAADWRRAAEGGRSREEMVEITVVATVICWLNCVSTLLALPPPDDSIRSWPRQALDGMRERLRRRPRFLLDAPLPADGTASTLLAALGRTPLATAIRQCVDDALSSSVLPPRIKLLLIATTARALGCRTCEREACQALSAVGVSQKDAERILAHLGAPGLDEREPRLLSLARNAALRTDAAAIQREVREATRDCSSPEVLEIVGTIALANLLGRLSAVVECC
jgi:AhpD family alkylhydroperoxidase